MNIIKYNKTHFYSQHEKRLRNKHFKTHNEHL